MFSENSWLFFKSSIFSYGKRIALLVFGFLYTYVIANALGAEKYGLAMFVLAFVGNLVYLFGTEPLGNTLIVFTPRYKSKKLFMKFAKLLLLGFSFLFALFFFFPQQVVLLLNKGNAPLFKYAALLFFLFPFFLLFEAFFKGLKSFGKVFKVSFIESFTNLCLATFFIIILHQGIIGLIFAKIVSLLAASLLYVYLFLKCKFAEKEIELFEVKKYVKNIFAASLMKKLTLQVMLFYMGIFISNAFLGLYYLAEKIVSYVVEMPIAALSETMLPFASEKANNKSELSKLVSLNIKFTLIFGAIFGLIIILFGNFILAILFPKYATAYWILPFFVIIFLTTASQFLGGAYKSINRADVLVKQQTLLFFIALLFGYLLVSHFALLGLLSLRILINVVSGAFLYFNQKKVGLQIEIIPRARDLRFFASVFKQVIRRGLQRFGL